MDIENKASNLNSKTCFQVNRSHFNDFMLIKTNIKLILIVYSERDILNPLQNSKKIEKPNGIKCLIFNR